MPPLTDERTRGNVVREWISGFPRDQIAEHTGIGAGTVSSIIANYKAGLDDLHFDSIRQLAVEARQHGWNFAELASHVRLYNYFIKSGAAEDKIESFISNVSSNDISPENVIESILYYTKKVQSNPSPRTYLEAGTIANNTIYYMRISSAMSDNQFTSIMLPQVMEIIKSFKILHPIAVQPEQQQSSATPQEEQQQIPGIIP